MADVNINSRVKAKIDGKSYDLRPSGNPHQKLPAKVVKYLEDNGLIADAIARPQAAAGSSDLARMQAEIDSLTGELASAKEDLAKANESLSAAELERSAALAEIEKLNKK